MLPNDSELQQLRDRWSNAKYKTVLAALENLLPQDAWKDMCDTIVHPADKKLANDLRGIRLLEKNLKNLGSVMAQTKFDDTLEARRVVAISNTEKQDCIEWCAIVPDA